MYVSFSRYTIYHLHATYNLPFFQSHNGSHPVIAILLHDFNLSRIVFGCLCLIIICRYVSFSRYTIHHVHAIYNLPFFQSHNGSHPEIWWVTCDTTVSVSELDVNRKYRILRAKRLITRFGPTVILSVKDEGAAPVQIFLPRRYSDVFTDMDIEQVNSNAVFLHLISKGVYVPLQKSTCWQ